MRTANIQLSELDDYLRLVKYERDVTVRLHYLNEITQLKLKLLKEIEPMCKHLYAYRQRYKQWYKTISPELKEYIKKKKYRW